MIIKSKGFLNWQMAHVKELIDVPLGNVGSCHICECLDSMIACLGSVWSPLGPLSESPASWTVNVNSSDKCLIDNILTENPILNGNLLLA